MMGTVLTSAVTIVPMLKTTVMRMPAFIVIMDNNYDDNSYQLRWHTVQTGSTSEEKNSYWLWWHQLPNMVQPTMIMMATVMVVPVTN